MKYIFNVDNDNLALFMKNKGFTGNVNSYTCFFTFSAEWQNLNIFCVFTQHNKPYIAPIKDSECLFPHEVLADKGAVTIGVYGTIGTATDFRRISTNIVTVNIDVGAYNSGAIPGQPHTPEFWEILSNELNEHTDNREIHVTDEDKNIWDNKFDNPRNKSEVAINSLYGLKKSAAGKFEFEEIPEIPVNISDLATLEDLEGLGKRYCTAVVGMASAGYTAADVDVLCDDGNVSDKLNSLIADIGAKVADGGFVGGKIVLLEGLYPILAPVNISVPNITVEGMGAGTVLKRGFDSASSQATRGLFRLTKENTTIKQIKFNDDFANRNNSYNYCIWTKDVSKCNISDNIFTDGGHYIYAGGFSDGIISNNSFDGQTNTLITLNSSANTTVIGNKSENIDDGCLINLGGCQFCAIENNIADISITSCSFCTITDNKMMKFGALYSKYTTITKNVVLEDITIYTWSEFSIVANNQCCKIYINNTERITVSDNVCTYQNVNDSGILLENSHICSVTGNIVNGCPMDAGIKLVGSEYNIVSGNVAIDNLTGILLENSVSNTITGNQPVGNLEGSIDLISSGECIITSNVIDCNLSIISSPNVITANNSNI